MQLASSSRLSTAVTLLLAGYPLPQVAEQAGCSLAELQLLQELLDAKLILPQPVVRYLPDGSGHIDVLAEYEELIPVFKGQVHVALLSATIASTNTKGSAGPDLVKDYATMLLHLAKLHQMAGINATPSAPPPNDQPTLKAVLEAQSA